MDITSMAREANQTSREHGWYDSEQPSRSFGDLCMLFTSEIAEAFEEFRDGRSLTEIYWKCGVCGDEIALKDGDLIHPPEQHIAAGSQVYCAGTYKPEGVPIEIADLYIRTGDTIAEEDIPIILALTIKMEYNKRRAYRHGGKRL